jgi:hypothetical protein
VATTPSNPTPQTSGGAPTSAPSDNTTLVEVLDQYAEGGFDSTFWAEEGGIVRCEACDSTLEPGRMKMQSLRRLEGASDPDDMMAVVAMECPVCGRAGTMVLGFGPSASEADQQVMSCLQDRRLDDGVPAASAPGEAVDQTTQTGK